MRLNASPSRVNSSPLLNDTRVSSRPAAIDSVGSWSFVLARESLPDEVAYRLARALHGAEAGLCKKLLQACETTAANTVSSGANGGSCGT